MDEAVSRLAAATTRWARTKAARRTITAPGTTLRSPRSRCSWASARLARQIVENAKAKRIAGCIEPDGQQPEELERTKGLHYCVFNMSAMSVLARIGEQLDVDLWNYESARTAAACAAGSIS